MQADCWFTNISSAACTTLVAYEYCNLWFWPWIIQSRLTRFLQVLQVGNEVCKLCPTCVESFSWNKESGLGGTLLGMYIMVFLWSCDINGFVIQKKRWTLVKVLFLWVRTVSNHPQFTELKNWHYSSDILLLSAWCECVRLSTNQQL